MTNSFDITIKQFLSGRSKGIYICYLHSDKAKNIYNSEVTILENGDHAFKGELSEVSSVINWINYNQLYYDNVKLQ